MKVHIGHESAEAIQITGEMFHTHRFPSGIEIRPIPWEGHYARELESKHGPLEVPFLLTEEGETRLKLGDWVVTYASGEKRALENHEFEHLCKPVAE